MTKSHELVRKSDKNVNLSEGKWETSVKKPQKVTNLWKKSNKKSQTTEKCHKLVKKTLQTCEKKWQNVTNQWKN